MKHSPLYNTHRKDQKTPERHPASPPLLQGRAPPAIAETSLLLQHSLHNYRKILHSFNIKFQLLPLAAAICQPTKDSSHIKKHNEQKHPTRGITLQLLQHVLLCFLCWQRGVFLPRDARNINVVATCSLQSTPFNNLFSIITIILKYNETVYTLSDYI